MPGGQESEVGAKTLGGVMWGSIQVEVRFNHIWPPMYPVDKGGVRELLVLRQKWGVGGHPTMTEKRREGPGDLKSTVRRWPLPSSLAPGSGVGAGSEITK